MQTNNRLFDDLARVASGAFNTLSGLREEIETRVRERVERMAADLDLVTREEFDAVRTMAAKARAAQEELETRVAKLEAEFQAAHEPRPVATKAPRAMLTPSSSAPNAVPMAMTATPITNSSRDRRPAKNPTSRGRKYIPAQSGGRRAKRSLTPRARGRSASRGGR